MAQEHQLDKRRGTCVLLSILAIWGLAVAVCARTGVYHALPPLLLAPIIALGIVVPVIVYALSWKLPCLHRSDRPAAADGISYLAHRGRAAFFCTGRITSSRKSLFKTLDGATSSRGFWPLASSCCLKISTGTPESSSLRFTDFVVAVGTGVIFFLLKDPRISSIQTLPMALIILYGVGISGASHIMAFDLLRHHSGIEPGLKHAAVKA